MSADSTIKQKLTGGTVVNAHIAADLPRSAAPKSKQITVTRLPGGYKAVVEVQTKAGLVELEIDASTARAIAAVFGEEPEPLGRKCGNCGGYGHNSRTCPGEGAVTEVAVAEPTPASAKRNKCKKCDKTGHNSRTCPLNAS